MALEDRTGWIDHGGEAYLWEQVADYIARDVDSGALAAGAKLPTEPELSEQYGVSRITVRRAVQELASRGVLRVRHGRGTFVTRGE